jgi:hypothetical protein
MALQLVRVLAEFQQPFSLPDDDVRIRGSRSWRLVDFLRLSSSWMRMRTFLWAFDGQFRQRLLPDKVYKPAARIR